LQPTEIVEKLLSPGAMPDPRIGAKPIQQSRAPGW
jgi:hypothetical protein